MGEIKINYAEVYAKTAEIRKHIQSELQQMDTVYRQTQSSLQRMDSSTNAAIIETMALNQEKNRASAEVLTKLLSFIDTAAKQIERDESMIANVFARTHMARERGPN